MTVSVPTVRSTSVARLQEKPAAHLEKYGERVYDQNTLNYTT